MVPELSLEVIYYKQKTDFKLEFALCSACSVRFLSTLTETQQDFTNALRRAFSRSRAVVLVGSFLPKGPDYLPRLLAETVGLRLEGVDTAHFGITNTSQLLLPQGGLPLVTVHGHCGGCVVEKADQSLILLTDEQGLRQELTEDLICPYLAYFAEHKAFKKRQRGQGAAEKQPQPPLPVTPNGAVNSGQPAALSAKTPGATAQNAAVQNAAVQNATAQNAAAPNAAAPNMVVPGANAAGAAAPHGGTVPFKNAAPQGESSNLNPKNTLAQGGGSVLPSKPLLSAEQRAAKAAEPALSGLAKAEEIIHSALKTADDIIAAVHAGKSLPNPAAAPAYGAKFTAAQPAESSTVTGTDFETTVNSPETTAGAAMATANAEPAASSAQAAWQKGQQPVGQNKTIDTPAAPETAGNESEFLPSPKAPKGGQQPEPNAPLAGEPLPTAEAKQPYSDPEFTLLTEQEAPVTEDSVLPVEAPQTPVECERETGYSVLEQPDCLGDNAYGSFLEGETPNRRRRKVIRAIISVILVICVILAAYFGYEYVYQPVHCSAVYNGVREMYGQTWGELPENMLVKFGRLYSMNRDISGWLSLPECDINYPVVTTVNRSAAYYNTHLFEGSVSEYGTPYINQTTDAESFYRNLVVYGKSFEDGQMFSKLRNYLNLEVYRKAPVISFDTVYLESKWKVVAVFETAQENAAEYCQSVFFDDDAFALYLEKIRSASVIETGIGLTAQDELLTLTSEQNGKSVIVVSRKVREGESPLVDVTESHVRDYKKAEDKTVQAAASASLKEESSAPNKPADSSVDKSMIDGASSRYEQSGPSGSQVTVPVKPSKPVSSAPSSSTVSSRPVGSAGSSSSSAGSSQSSAPTPAVKLPNITVTNQSTGQKVNGNAADILAQVIEAEMGSGYHLEALKAQTVAAYSWLICNGALKGGAPAVPMKPAGARAKQAVKEVAGVVAVYGGNVAQTYYYAISAGHTANCQDVWLGSLPYLVSVDSSVDKNISGYQTVRSYRAADVAKWVKETTGVDLTALSDKSKWFQCRYDAHGLYVKTVTIGGKLSKKGPYLREQIFTSARVGSANVLRSSAYTITYNKAEDKFIFTVRGYGHGIGMSQVGANAYAKNGWSFEQILKHYYKGITLGMYTQ